MSNINRRGAVKALGTILGGASAAAAGAAVAAATPRPDPVVELWARAQALSAEWDRVSTEQETLRCLIVGRNPLQPPGTEFDEWYRNDVATTRCTVLRERSTELGVLTCDVYDKIAAAVAITPEGIRAKAAAALSLWVQEGHLRDNIWHYDLILNALREAAVGSAAI